MRKILRIPSLFSVYGGRSSIRNKEQFLSRKSLSTMHTIEKSKNLLRWNARSSPFNGSISAAGLLYQRFGDDQHGYPRNKHCNFRCNQW